MSLRWIMISQNYCQDYIGKQLFKFLLFETLNIPIAKFRPNNLV